MNNTLIIECLVVVGISLAVLFCIWLICKRYEARYDKEISNLDILVDGKRLVGKNVYNVHHWYDSNSKKNYLLRTDSGGWYIVRRLPSIHGERISENEARDILWKEKELFNKFFGTPELA
jgi:hypothetical protein